MSDDDCDKGPAIERIELILQEHQQGQERQSAAFIKSQDKLTEAIIKVAQQQEKIVALVDKTADNKQNIDNVYDLNRETEKRLTDHILTSGHSSPGQPDVLPKQDSKFDKLQIAIIGAVILGAGNAFLDILKSITDQLSKLNGGP